MKNQRIRILVEMGLAAALFVVLDFFNVRLPINLAGGSISFVMLPIVILALLRGPVVGIALGALCGFLDLVFGPTIIHPAQLLLDYPLSYACVGLAGLLSVPLRQAFRSRAYTRVSVWAVVGTIVGGIFRLIPATVSGVIFFKEYATSSVELFALVIPTKNIWFWSVLYNLSYIALSVALVAVAAAVIMPLVGRGVSLHVHS